MTALCLKDSLRYSTDHVVLLHLSAKVRTEGHRQVRRVEATALTFNKILGLINFGGRVGGRDMSDPIESLRLKVVGVRSS